MGFGSYIVRLLAKRLCSMQRMEASERVHFFRLMGGYSANWLN